VLPRSPGQEDRRAQAIQDVLLRWRIGRDEGREHRGREHAEGEEAGQRAAGSDPAEREQDASTGDFSRCRRTEPDRGPSEQLGKLDPRVDPPVQDVDEEVDRDKATEVSRTTVCSPGER
jgi:hypothetical protein